MGSNVQGSNEPRSHFGPPETSCHHSHGGRTPGTPSWTYSSVASQIFLRCTGEWLRFEVGLHLALTSSVTPCCCNCCRSSLVYTGLSGMPCKTCHIPSCSADGYFLLKHNSSAQDVHPACDGLGFQTGPSPSAPSLPLPSIGIGSQLVMMRGV